MNLIERYRERQRLAEKAAVAHRAARQLEKERRAELRTAIAAVSEIATAIAIDPAERLRRNTRQERGHLLWTGQVNRRGLPTYQRKVRGVRRKYSARQLAWSVRTGAVSSCVLAPSCGRALCLSHLVEGRPIGKAATNKPGTLTIAQVHEIRAFVGPITRAIASRWGVSPSACRDVRNRKSYPHVNEVAPCS